MKDIRKTARDLQTGARRAGREVDGHTVSDDVGNAGDQIRKDADNARDEAKSGSHDSHTRSGGGRRSGSH